MKNKILFYIRIGKLDYKRSYIEIYKFLINWFNWKCIFILLKMEVKKIFEFCFIIMIEFMIKYLFLYVYIFWVDLFIGLYVSRSLCLKKM